MTLASGRGWIVPTRKQELQMATKPITGYRVSNDLSKPTKFKLSKKPPKMARNKAMKTARLAKKWAEKSRAKP